jgi:hypothetical protein
MFHWIFKSVNEEVDGGYNELKKTSTVKKLTMGKKEIHKLLEYVQLFCLPLNVTATDLKLL